MDYTIVRHPKRRRLSLQITSERELKVLAPLGVSVRKITQFVSKQEDWILQTLEKIPVLDKPQFQNGETFLYLGDRYPLVLQRGAQTELTLNKGCLYLHCDEIAFHSIDKKADMLEKWYRLRAKDIIVDRVEIYAEQMGLRPNQIRIKGHRSRWGSCSNKGNLNFNWRLILTPIEVLDYVVVHELAHLVHMNHSASFWQLVAVHCPEYKAHKKWLKIHAGSLFTLG